VLCSKRQVYLDSVNSFLLFKAAMRDDPISSESDFVFPGRVKTLHPGVHGGILARRDLQEHLDAVNQHSISLIDVVGHPSADPTCSTVARSVRLILEYTLKQTVKCWSTVFAGNQCRTYHLRGSGGKEQIPSDDFQTCHRWW